MPDMSRFADSLEWLGPVLLGLAALFAVIALVKWLGRRSANGGGRGASTERRLAVLDQITLDEKRRLVLIRRDDVQHLVILGGANELLVESGIGAGRPAAGELVATRQTITPRPERELAPTPRPVAPPQAPVAPRQTAPMATPVPPPQPRPEPRPAPVAAPAPVAERPEPPVSPPAPATLPPVAPPPLAAAPLAEPSSVPPPVAPSYTFEPPPAPQDLPATAEPRVAVKVDPQFAAMSGRLEEILRRPFERDAAHPEEPHVVAPPVVAPPPTVVPAPAARPAPEVQPPTTARPGDPNSKDDLESQMASLLGRAPTR